MTSAENNIRSEKFIPVGISLVILLVYYLNLFVNLNDLVETISFVLLAALGLTLLIRYKQFLLYSLALIIPASVPVSLGGGTTINAPSELICALLGFFFLVKFLMGKRPDKNFLRHPITILISLDLAWLFISSCTSEIPLVSFKRLFIKLIYYITFYYFYFELFKLDQKNIRRVILLHCLGMLIPIASATWFHAGLGFTTMGSQLAASPFYNDHTMYGAALVFFLPFLAYYSFKKNRNQYIYILLLIVVSSAAFLSYSRAAWISLFFSTGISFFILFKFRTLHYALLVISLLLSIFFFRDSISDYLTRTKEVSHSNDVGMHLRSISNINSDASNLERVNRWKCAIRMFADKPVFGFGPGTYQFFYGSYQVRKDMTHISTFLGTKGHAHSEYLNYLSETGLPGCIIFITLLGTIVTTSIRLYRRLSDKELKNLVLVILLGLITFIVHAFFNGFIEFDKIAMPVFMSFAAITFLDLANKKQKA